MLHSVISYRQKSKGEKADGGYTDESFQAGAGNQGAALVPGGAAAAQGAFPLSSGGLFVRGLSDVSALWKGRIFPVYQGLGGFRHGQ